MKRYIICILISCLFGCSRKSSLKTGLEGQLMPNFSILSLDSSTKLSTNSIPLGRPTTLFYFSPRCPYCRAEINEILANINKLGQIQFYMISNSSISEIRKFDQEYKLDNYSNIIIGHATFYSFANYFKARGVPYMAIYGKDKRLKGVYSGQAKSKDIEATANQ